MKVRTLLLYLILCFGAFIALYPFLWMLGAAFKTLNEASTPSLRFWPKVWQWSNVVETFRAAPFGRYFFNSFFVAGTVCLSVCVTALMAGYAFARLQFKGRQLLFFIILGSMMVPFELTFIPNFVLISKLGWYNSYAALIVPWCVSAFSIFLMRQAFLALPRDYYDAAVLDGCGHLRFLIRIGIPLVMPSLVTVALFAFLGSYNALLWPLIVTADDSLRVVQIGLTSFYSDAGARINLLMCASSIIILPTVVVYFLAQRHFVQNTLGTGIKG
ncbi:MAG: carbohydrate ABC transporter permease [Candidatus Hydrogenedens sp.]|jgi:ABC-type glycerol-3-phosphate transport system permease component|nr:carbohydrate ABC transporter permease [Candidatus Hydrogenedens sp.]